MILWKKFFRKKRLNSPDEKIINSTQELLGKGFYFLQVRTKRNYKIPPNKKLRNMWHIYDSIDKAYPKENKTESEYVMIFRRKEYNNEIEKKLRMSLKTKNWLCTNYKEEKVIPTEKLKYQLSKILNGKNKLLEISASPDADYDHQGEAPVFLNHKFLLVSLSLENVIKKLKELK